MINNARHERPLKKTSLASILFAGDCVSCAPDDYSNGATFVRSALYHQCEGQHIEIGLGPKGAIGAEVPLIPFACASIFHRRLASKPRQRCYDGYEGGIIAETKMMEEMASHVADTIM